MDLVAQVLTSTWHGFADATSSGAEIARSGCQARLGGTRPAASRPEKCLSSRGLSSSSKLRFPLKKGRGTQDFRKDTVRGKQFPGCPLTSSRPARKIASRQSQTLLLICLTRGRCGAFNYCWAPTASVLANSRFRSALSTLDRRHST